MKLRRKWWLGAGVTAVALVVVLLFAVGRRPVGMPVRVADVQREDLVSLVTANGTLQARTKVDLSSNIMGQITALFVEEGDVVHKGELLLVIDPAQHRTVVESRRSSLQALESEVRRSGEGVAQAAREWQRAERQFEEGILAASEHDLARSRYEQAAAALQAAEREVGRAEAELAGARDELAKTEIRAPMDGVVTRRNVEAGEVAVTGTMNNPGTVLMTISDMATTDAVIEVDQTDVPNLRSGQRATVLIDAFPGRSFPGVVSEIASSPLQGPSAITGQPATGTDYEVKVTLEEQPPGVRPGLTVTADITTATRNGVLTVPIGALVLQQEDKAAAREPDTANGNPVSEPGPPTSVASRTRDVEGVFVVENGKAVFRPVTTGIKGEMHVEVVEGVHEGEKVVAGPFRALRTLDSGDRVRIRTTGEDEPEPE